METAAPPPGGGCPPARAPARVPRLCHPLAGPARGARLAPGAVGPGLRPQRVSHGVGGGARSRDTVLKKEMGFRSVQRERLGGHQAGAEGGCLQADPRGTEPGHSWKTPEMTAAQIKQSTTFSQAGRAGGGQSPAVTGAALLRHRASFCPSASVIWFCPNFASQSFPRSSQQL